MVKKLIVISVVIWLSLTGSGLFFLWDYENTPSVAANAPREWPRTTRISLDPRLSTLVMAIHPHCPCSRATIGELAVLMTHSQGLVNVQLLFVKPSGFRENWEKTDLWTSAAMIPGVNLSVDVDGQDAARFGSHTSGQAFLFSSEGHLLFSGGITGARGHSGDNDGRSAIQSLLVTGKAVRTQTPVFGCPLDTDSLNQQADKTCNALHKN
jgi:hypothetical protein